MSKFTSFLASIGINTTSVELIGGRLVGWGAALNTTNAGGYMEPNSINGYQFNPADGEWCYRNFA